MVKHVDTLKDVIRMHSTYRLIAALDGYDGLTVKRTDEHNGYWVTVKVRSQIVSQIIDENYLVTPNDTQNIVTRVLHQLYSTLTRPIKANTR